MKQRLVKKSLSTTYVTGAVATESVDGNAMEIQINTALIDAAANGHSFGGGPRARNGAITN